MNTSLGAGRTVAIVVPYHHPRLAADLAIYRSRFHVPPCTPINGCLRVIDERGGKVYPAPNAHWAFEEALDVEAVSAACPRCKILVVEASKLSEQDLMASVGRAVLEGARFISGSWTINERAVMQRERWDSYFRSHPGIAFVWSAGDDFFGSGVDWPASSSYVTAVGGTVLQKGAQGWSEKTWSDTTSGCSLFEPKPPFQHDALCSRRTVADVSAVAYPGLLMYTTLAEGDPGWNVAYGTSLSAPLIAAMYAMAGVPGRQDYPNAYPYRHPEAFHDITTGHNYFPCGTYLCKAVPGYDGPTGLGTPRGVRGFSK